MKNLPPIPSIYTIEQKTKNSSPYFFDHKTMAVFGQTMEKFKVYRTDNENEFLISCKSKQGFYTTRIFNDITNTLNRVES